MADPGGDFRVAVRLSKTAAATISRAEVVVTGSSMAEISAPLAIDGDTLTGVVRAIPAGPNRRFTINGYDAGGTLIYTGSATASVLAGQQVTVDIIVRPVDATVRLSVVSPIVAHYGSSYNKSPLPVTGEVSNPSTKTALNVVIAMVARNSSGSAMGQTSVSVASAAPGRTIFTKTFPEYVYSSIDSPVKSIEYTITHSLGGPDTGTVVVSGS